MATRGSAKRILVLGGGVSGLSSAYYLQQGRQRLGNNDVKIFLWEKAKRCGGWINSFATEQGAVHEVGPRSIRASGPGGSAALLLAEELQMVNDILFVPSTDISARNRFIYVNKKLHRLPSGLGGMLRRQKPFSKPLAYYGLLEFLRQRNSTGCDESIYSFIERRLGSEVARYLIDAMTRGIFAGDSKKLSMDACFPQIKKYEQDRGSIIRGALFPSRSSHGNKPELVPDDTALLKRVRDEKWSIWSFKEGLQALTDRLYSKVVERGADVRLGVECQRLEVTPESTIKAHSTDGSSLEVDHVISTLYAPLTASLVAQQQPRLATLLESIPAANVSVVNLEYPMKKSSMVVQGFGHLVPSCEKSKVLGIIYDSCIFPQHDRKDVETVRYTCMMGGAWFEELFGDPLAAKTSTFEEAAASAIREQLGVTADPLTVRASLLKECIPQYVIGHLDTVQQIEDEIKGHGLPISLIGSSYKGVSVGDCVREAKSLAHTLCRS